VCGIKLNKCPALTDELVSARVRPQAPVTRARRTVDAIPDAIATRTRARAATTPAFTVSAIAVGCAAAPSVTPSNRSTETVLKGAATVSALPAHLPPSDASTSWQYVRSPVSLVHRLTRNRVQSSIMTQVAAVHSGIWNRFAVLAAA
jgi:hypothetical protein